MAIDFDQPIFVISVAAELADMHPQTLRQYDRLGIVSPSRAPGKSRRYSQRDVNMLREVQRLSQEGVSLEGIKRILQLENQVAALQRRVGELTAGTGPAPPGRRFADLRRRNCRRRRQPGPRQASAGAVAGAGGVAAEGHGLGLISRFPQVSLVSRAAMTRPRGMCQPSRFSVTSQCRGK